jgi:hypothetical protein
VVSFVMSEYVKRVLPQVELHKLGGEAQYSGFFNCDHCHRELFKTVFHELAGLEDLDSNSKSHTSKKDPEKQDDEEPLNHPVEPVKLDMCFFRDIV